MNAMPYRMEMQIAAEGHGEILRATVTNAEGAVLTMVEMSRLRRLVGSEISEPETKLLLQRVDRELEADGHRPVYATVWLLAATGAVLVAGELADESLAWVHPAFQVTRRLSLVEPITDPLHDVFTVTRERLVSPLLGAATMCGMAPALVA